MVKIQERRILITYVWLLDGYLQDDCHIWTLLMIH